MSPILPYSLPCECTSGTMTSQRPDVSPRASLAQPANEATLRPRGASSHSQHWLEALLYLYHATKTTICCSKANFLLIFIPLSIIAAAKDWSPVAVFTLSFLAIFPLAELLSWSTEQLSASVGQTLGGLLNATFGNAVEMIVSRACTTLLNLFC